MNEHNCIEELGHRLAIREPSEFRSIVFNLGSDEALRINQDLSVTLNPNVPHDDIVKAVFESVSSLIQKQIEDEVQKRLKGKEMKTCFLVYRFTKFDNERDVVKIFSTAEKAEEFIKVLEKISKNTGGYVEYEYEEEEIE